VTSKFLILHIFVTVQDMHGHTITIYCLYETPYGEFNDHVTDHVM